MKNLDGLLRMPYGCGEQNMALLAPNIYILEYLRNTEQLTTTILDKAKGFLTSGQDITTLYHHPLVCLLTLSTVCCHAFSVGSV